jgi:FtsP/CotA-like multicopper oxidase with cupredoxin domain
VADQKIICAFLFNYKVQNLMQHDTVSAMNSTTLKSISTARARRGLVLSAVISWSIGSSFAEAPNTPRAVSAPVLLAAETPATPSSAEYRSKDGQLDVTLHAKETVVYLGTTDIRGATYNDLYGGPVLRVKPGDFLHVHLINDLPQATSIHFHGLNVSPQGHGDNSMHMVAPGESWDYEIPVPKDHPPGVYWIHTRAHVAAERQLMGGLSGTLVVE